MIFEDKYLFTPGPLTTSQTVKAAMARDLGSRDTEFIQVVKTIRQDLVKLAGVDLDYKYDSVLMQGAGTFGVESIISTVIPEDGHLLVIKNGAYGQRIENMAKVHSIKTSVLAFSEDEIPQAEIVKEFLKDNTDVTHVAIVHCETTTGIFNELNAIGGIVKQAGAVYMVDAMSSFGAVPIDMLRAGIDYLISSSNKCIEGVPGFSFIIFNKEDLNKCKGQSRTLSLDLYEQWTALESNGQFRFTPPIQSILAFHQAIKELIAEGGVKARAARYKNNHKVLMEGMTNLGFIPYLKSEVQGYIISSFLFPENDSFDFNVFYNFLNERGLVIYPGKLTQADCFRIGNIGQLHQKQLITLIETIELAIDQLGIELVQTQNK
ncbi:2-aminoethylphosphonate--pyruvate transaminase [Marinifilum sp.]|uniref:2-aminoethylphosphonate--pyruvate transaminase n=1 Tax=Marinifilum sp. TaxID=2033137 RepID=UPI003BABD9A2